MAIDLNRTILKMNGGLTLENQFSGTKPRNRNAWKPLDDVVYDKKAATRKTMTDLANANPGLKANPDGQGGKLGIGLTGTVESPSERWNAIRTGIEAKAAGAITGDSFRAGLKGVRKDAGMYTGNPGTDKSAPEFTNRESEVRKQYGEQFEAKKREVATDVVNRMTDMEREKIDKSFQPTADRNGRSVSVAASNLEQASLYGNAQDMREAREDFDRKRAEAKAAREAEHREIAKSQAETEDFIARMSKALNVQVDAKGGRSGRGRFDRIGTRVSDSEVDVRGDRFPIPAGSFVVGDTVYQASR